MLAIQGVVPMTAQSVNLDVTSFASETSPGSEGRRVIHNLVTAPAALLNIQGTKKKKNQFVANICGGY